MKTINLEFNLTEEEIKVILLFKKERLLYEHLLSDKQVAVLDRLHGEGLIQRFTFDYLENYAYELIQHEKILNQLK